jgi:hypothetical protein
MDTLEIMVTRHEYPQEPGKAPTAVRDEQLFHVVVIDQELVQYARTVVSTLPGFWGWGSYGYPNHLAYVFEFATDTQPTLIYSGATNVSGWQLDDMVSTRCVRSAAAIPPIVDLMTTLHTRFGMPYWGLAHDGRSRPHTPDTTEGFVRR